MHSAVFSHCPGRQPFAACLIFACLCLTIIDLNCGAVGAQERPLADSPKIEGISELLNSEMGNTEFALRLAHLTREELADLAKIWLKITQKQIKEAANINIQLSKEPDGPAAERLLAELDHALERRGRLFVKLALIIDEWEAKGGKPEEAAEYRDYVRAVIRKELRATDPTTLKTVLLDWLTSPDGGIRIGRWLLNLAIALLLLFFIAKSIAALFRRSLSRSSRMSRLLRDFLSKAAYWIILGLGFLLVLSLFGINVTPMLAAFGGASFIIGFATQSTLSNLASGLLLMITRPFDVGDDVELAGESGKVQKVSIVSTTILSDDNRTIVVPNTKVWDSVIVNLESSKEQRAD